MNIFRKTTVIEVEQDDFEEFITEQCGHTFSGSEDEWYEGTIEIDARRKDHHIVDGKDLFFFQSEVDEFLAGELCYRINNYVCYLVSIGKMEEGVYKINLNG